MRSRLKAFLLVLVTGAALVAGLASPAHAASCTIQSTGNVIYTTPYANTGYGPVSHGVQHASPYARAGFYSPLTGGFSATTDWVGINGLYPLQGYRSSSDGSGSYLTMVDSS
jgi:hypothetical protein